MAESKTGRVYDEKTRSQAVRILETGAGHRALASKLGIPEATARQWARSYAVGGKAAVMNAGRTHRVYSYETKLAAVKDRLENGMTVREVMVKYNIPSESSIKTWCRQYKKYGSDALVNKPRGVKPKKKAEEGEAGEAGEGAQAGEGAEAGEPNQQAAEAAEAEAAIADESAEQAEAAGSGEQAWEPEPEWLGELASAEFEYDSSADSTDAWQADDSPTEPAGESW